MLSLHKLSYLFVLLVDLSLHPLELPVICALHLQHIYIWQTGAGEARCQPEGLGIESLGNVQYTLVFDDTKNT